jgi:amidophosphoribosyltransferase
MAGLFALSINPKTYQGNFLEDLFWGTFYQQHLGEEWGGLAVCNRGGVEVRTRPGLLRPTLGKDLGGLEGNEGIGYCGSAKEPILVESRLQGKFAACFSGNIRNLDRLIKYLKEHGQYSFERGDDVEIISALVGQVRGTFSGIKRATKMVMGAMNFLLLNKEGIYAICDPSGHWPLAIGEKEGATAISSESNGFYNLGFKLVRNLKPGEVVLLKEGKLETKEFLSSPKIQICSFLWVYTAFPNTIIEDIPASAVRIRLGAALARQDIKKGFTPDMVIPDPDSGRFHAIGYHQEFCRQMNEKKINKVPFYNEVLLKFPYAGRSYILSTQKARDLEAQIKILPSGESYDGKKVVVCDDSIVRGTQIQTNLVPKLRSLGIKEIHFRISNPELLSHCPWGKTTKKGETLASRLPSKEDRIKFLDIESLEYNTIEELIKAIGLPREKLCIDCALPSEE